MQRGHRASRRIDFANAQRLPAIAREVRRRKSHVRRRRWRFFADDFAHSSKRQWRDSCAEISEHDVSGEAQSVLRKSALAGIYDAVRPNILVKSLEKPYLPLALALLVVGLLWIFHATDSLNRAFFDSRSVATANPSAIPTNGVLVLIDEDSLKTIGERYSARWPWPRSLFAAMIASLHQAGAKKILMDFEFLEPSAPEHDDVLAAYAAACPEVILGRTRDKTPIFWQNDFQKQFPQFAVTNRLGLVDFAPDDDGVIVFIRCAIRLRQRPPSKFLPKPTLFYVGMAD